MWDSVSSGMRMAEGRGVGQCIIWYEDEGRERSGTMCHVCICC